MRSGSLVAWSSPRVQPRSRHLTASSTDDLSSASQRPSRRKHLANHSKLRPPNYRVAKSSPSASPTAVLENLRISTLSPKGKTLRAKAEVPGRIRTEALEAWCRSANMKRPWRNLSRLISMFSTKTFDSCGVCFIVTIARIQPEREIHHAAGAILSLYEQRPRSRQLRRTTRRAARGLSRIIDAMIAGDASSFPYHTELTEPPLTAKMLDSSPTE